MVTKKSESKRVRDRGGEGGGGRRDITLGTLDLFVRAVVAEYPGDPSRPGVTVSLLSGGEWYAAVLRYAEKYGGGKSVVCSARGETLAGCLRALGDSWLLTIRARDRFAAAICGRDQAERKWGL
jgi:hypothetical protein